MAQKTSTNMTAAQIAEKQRPGWKATAPAGPVRAFGVQALKTDSVREASAKVDAVLPDTEHLLRKYLGADAAQAAPSSDAPPSDVELVDLKSGDLERTVGVNVQSQKIEWSQG